MIEIDKDIPLPPLAGPGRTPIYPWRTMQVGDSFLHPGSIRRATAAAWEAAKNIGGGLKFACRTTPEGVRVWRIA